jgi:hypothetical protein
VLENGGGGVRGSVTWRGGERQVCFFCEDVAGSTGFGGNRGFVGGWHVGPGVWPAGVARGDPRFAKFQTDLRMTVGPLCQ